MKHLLNVGIAIVSLSTLGCNLYAPPSINENRIQVNSEVFMRDIALSNVTDELLAGLAHDYIKHGSGAMDLIVTYDPDSYRNTAMKATNKMSDIAGTLRESGVANIKSSIMPVKHQGDDVHLLVSYNSFTAHAPKGCDNLLPGMNGSALEYNADYKLGCSVDTMTARQVAKPSHLLGRGATGAPTDGRAASNIVDAYRAGAQNEPLDGESASEE